MTALTNALRVGAQLLVKRFRTEMVRTQQRADEVEALLLQVRAVELRRGSARTQLPLAAKTGPYSDCVMACIDRRSDRVVGAMRGTMGPLLQQNPGLAPMFRFDLQRVPEGLLSECAYVQQFAVLPDFRGGAAALVLALAFFRQAYAQGIRLLFLNCEPGLYNTYLSMGARPLDRVYARPGGGFSISMVFVLGDGDHLRQLRSPVWLPWLLLGRPRTPEALAWYRGLPAPPSGRGIAAVDPNAPLDHPLFEGVSPQGTREALYKAMRVDCEAGQLAMAGGDGVTWMALVERGSLEVSVQGRPLGREEAGSTVGEMAWLLGGARTADVHAGASGAGLILLSRSSLRRITSPRDAARVWQNIARGLALKLVSHGDRPEGMDGR